MPHYSRIKSCGPGPRLPQTMVKRAARKVGPISFTNSRSFSRNSTKRPSGLKSWLKVPCFRRKLLPPLSRKTANFAELSRLPSRPLERRRNDCEEFNCIIFAFWDPSGSLTGVKPLDIFDLNFFAIANRKGSARCSIQGFIVRFRGWLE